ncbi:MAG: xylose isomerase [Verrucomicrobiales bacterium]
MAQPFFPSIKRIKYEGPDSKNALAFRHYNAEEKVGAQTMRDHLRFAVAYWHAMKNPLADPFGAGTAVRPWNNGKSPLQIAEQTARACFEFLDKAGIDFYCFHDRDVAPEMPTLKQSHEMLDKVAAILSRLQNDTGKKLLWGTACLFAHPRYMQGAATSPKADVFAYAAAQVKKAMDVTHQLHGAGYVFWGGREGYSSLINTNMKRELDHLAGFLHMAVAYKRKIGFKGQFYIEPKPKEPTTHQYDSDAAACLNFLREYDLLDHFKLNVETNHATLAGHTVQHDLTVAASAGALGSVDANTGDELIGWDTDQFPTNIYQTTQIMLVVLKMGGFTTGGLNFDSKVRRESYEPLDLFHAHIGGMDAFARGLKIAHAIIQDGRLDEFVKTRYSSFDSGIGSKIESRKTNFTDLEKYALGLKKSPLPSSGRQEMLENLINDFIR